MVPYRIHVHTYSGVVVLRKKTKKRPSKQSSWLFYVYEMKISALIKLFLGNQSLPTFPLISPLPTTFNVPIIFRFYSWPHHRVVVGGSTKYSGKKVVRIDRYGKQRLRLLIIRILSSVTKEKKLSASLQMDDSQTKTVNVCRWNCDQHLITYHKNKKCTQVLLLLLLLFPFAMTRP